MLATELAAFVDGVRRGVHPGVVTLNDARNGLRATDAILRSLATGGVVDAMILADAHLHLFRHGFPGVYGRSLLGSESRRLRGVPREARHRRRADRRLPGRRHRPGEQRLYPRAGGHPPVDGDARLCRTRRDALAGFHRGADRGGTRRSRHLRAGRSRGRGPVAVGCGDVAGARRARGHRLVQHPPAADRRPRRPSRPPRRDAG